MYPPKFLSILFTLAALGGSAVTAQARFIQPDEAVTEPAVKAAADKLKALKDVKDAVPVFQEIQAAADGGSAEAQFVLGYMLQSGLGTERSNEKAKAAYEKAVAKGPSRRSMKS